MLTKRKKMADIKVTKKNKTEQSSEQVNIVTLYQHSSVMNLLVSKTEGLTPLQRLTPLQQTIG